jgi:hypothetical protein
MTIDLRDHLPLDLFAEMDTDHEIGLLKGSIAVEDPGPRALHDPRTPGIVGIAAQAPDPVASMKEKPISQFRDGLHETCQRSRSLFWKKWTVTSFFTWKMLFAIAVCV